MLVHVYNLVEMVTSLTKTSLGDIAVTEDAWRLVAPQIPYA